MIKMALVSAMLLACTPAMAAPEVVPPDAPLLGYAGFLQSCIASGGQIGAPLKGESAQNFVIVDVAAARLVSLSLWSNRERGATARLRWTPVSGAEKTMTMAERQSVSITASKVTLEFSAAQDIQTVYCTHIL